MKTECKVIALNALDTAAIQLAINELWAAGFNIEFQYTVKEALVLICRRRVTLNP